MPFDGYPEDRGFRYVVAFVYSVAVAVFWIPAFVIRRLHRILRDIAAENWPRADGTITSGDVKVIHGWLADYALGRLDYCYKVHGEYYSGHCVSQFADEQAAWEFVDARRDKPVLVRYRDNHAGASVLRESDQLAFSNDSAPSDLASQVWQHWSDELRREPQHQEENNASVESDEHDIIERNHR
jgi:hypothetical protein